MINNNKKFNRFKKILLLTILSLFLGGCSLNTPIKTEQTSSKQEIKENVTIPQKEISPEEKEFNESGRAKAIEKETDLWQIYDSPELGFSFNYPMHVKLLKDNEYNEDKGETYIKIRPKDIGTKEWPTDLSLEDEKKNIKTLHRGEFGINRGFSLENSEKVKTVGFLFAQDFMTLARFEVCNVTLERSLIFYFNNKEITITLYGPIDTLKETMSEYFTINEENCFEEKIWDFEKQNDFYEKLVNGNGSSEIQEWFNLFDQISETIIFAHR
jgi:hypothetical protein